MTDTGAENFWKFIEKKYAPSWEDIEEVEPDEWDLKMLDGIANNPECHEYANENGGNL